MRKNAIELIPTIGSVELLFTKGFGQGKNPKKFSIGIAFFNYSTTRLQRVPCDFEIHFAISTDATPCPGCLTDPGG
jgi:hypothetical protein